MTELIQIAANPVVAKLMNASREAKLQVSQLLSYFVEGHEHMAAFKSRHWDGRSSFLDFNAGTFPAGFVNQVHTDLARKGYRVQLIKRKLPEPLGVENPIVDSFGNDDPRYDYQMETVNRLLRHGQMIAQIATGGGKSKIAKLAVARIKRPTLFLTTRSVLMHQMKDGFEEAGFMCGVLGDSEWSIRRGVNVGMVQTLAARIEDLSVEQIIARMVERNAGAKDREIAEKAKIKWHEHQHRRAQTIKFLEFIEFFIGEEAHEAGGASYYDIARYCRNAHYRLALTATPFMRPDAEANMRLMATFGGIGIQVSEKTLIERGILATPYFKYIDVPPPEKLRKRTSWPACYKLGVIEAVNRNCAICAETVRATKFGLPVMILVKQKAHGKALENMLKATGLKAKFIFGEHDNDERTHALRQLRDGKLQVLIGSTILDVGVDVPAVGMVILAGAGKEEVGLRQRVGRGLRAKKTGPNVAFVIDFSDTHNSYLREHAQLRRAIVDQTPGFAERVLPPGADFDFTGLGFVPLS